MGEKIAQHLNAAGIQAGTIHGDKTQGARTKALREFKGNFVRILVATDVAARGIDISNLPFVVNFDMPTYPNDYIHRIGRTGRAGQEGTAISLMSVDEHKFLRGIESLLKIKIDQKSHESFKPNDKPAGGGDSRSRKPKGRKSTFSRNNRSSDGKSRNSFSKPDANNSRKPGEGSSRPNRGGGKPGASNTGRPSSSSSRPNRSGDARPSGNNAGRTSEGSSRPNRGGGKPGASNAGRPGERSSRPNRGGGKKSGNSNARKKTGAKPKTSWKRD